MMKNKQTIKVIALLGLAVIQAEIVVAQSPELRTHKDEHAALVPAGGEGSGSAGSISYSIGQIIHDSSEGLHHGVQHTLAGCTNVAACNYNVNATDDDDSCEYPQEYYDCNGVCLNDSDGDGICNELEVVGCQEITACNYMESATDAGSCIYAADLDACATCSGATDGTGTIVDNDADNDGVCNADEIKGCTEESAFNYDPNATDADGSCVAFTSAIYCGSSLTGSTTGANKLDNTNDSPEAIYTFEVTTSGDYEFSTCGSGFDTYLRLYKESVNNLIDASDDDSNCSSNGYNSYIKKYLEPGSYYVLVEGYLTNSGNYELTVTCPSTSSTCSSGFTAVTIDVGGGTWQEEISWSLDQLEGGGENSTEACLDDGCHTFYTYDSYGDGWNGNTVTITTAEGEVLLTGTLDSGSEGSLDFSLGDCGTVSSPPSPTCSDGEVEDCNGNCVPGDWVGDGTCDNGFYAHNSISIYLNCPAFNNDGGDCDGDCYQVNMYDSWGDGWNGNTLSINGQEYTIESGHENDNPEQICFDDTGCINISMAEGSYPGEVLWGLTNSVGETVLMGEGASYDDCVQANTLVNVGQSFSSLVNSISSGQSVSDVIDNFPDVTGMCFGCRVDSPTNEEEVLVESEPEPELFASFNPKTQHLILKIKGNYDEPLNYQLYSVLGNLLDADKLTGIRTSINMDNLPEAVYLLKIRTTEKEVIKTLRIIKN